MLQGKSALITGGSSGIGLAAARMRDQGAHIAIMGTNEEKLNRAATELGPDVLTVQGDVASLRDLARLRDELSKNFGCLDILFANAGVAIGTPSDTTRGCMQKRDDEDGLRRLRRFF